ncbi:MAG TPA: hypothetical protein PK990_09800, partial [Salinivirgaceae bacterium]|nr:hypothetical protein [Salinivirgaceae bacterium]
MAENVGRIIQIIGPVVDVKFDNPQAKLPEIYEALKIVREGQ